MSTKKNFPERDFNMNKEKLTRVGLEALVNFSLFIQNLSKMYPVSFPCGLWHDIC